MFLNFTLIRSARSPITSVPPSKPWVNFKAKDIQTIDLVVFKERGENFLFMQLQLLLLNELIDKLEFGRGGVKDFEKIHRARLTTTF